jgi:HEAT repeat protein
MKMGIMNEKDHDSEAAKKIERHVENLASADEAVAIAAERQLIRFGAAAVDALLAATDSVNPQVRFRAVYALGKIGDARAHDRLVACAQDADPRVAQDAVAALACLVDPREVKIVGGNPTSAF